MQVLKPGTMKCLLIIGLLSCFSHMQGRSKYYQMMADSEMKRSPRGWMLDFSKQPKWNYCHGLVLQSILQVWEKTGDQKYFNYADEYAGQMIDDQGQIGTYRLDRYNIDHVNPGKMLFTLYRRTHKEKYKKAMELLHKQMETQPRTSDRGFWHKQVYPHQMWLDGLYMASPYLAQYGKEFNEPALFDEAVHQVLTVARHTYDPGTGLYYHGWDESRTQKWADPQTGKSPNFWSRSIGWYMMAMVDVLDFLPENHQGRQDIITILQNLSLALERYQDPVTLMWYQVTDQLGREGNYPESTGSIMFIYAWEKASQKGYLSEAYHHKAVKAYDSYLKMFVREEKDGTISITGCCSVAGLGGNPYRDGSYTYYVSEPVRDNDPKATGPFIMTSILLDR